MEPEKQHGSCLFRHMRCYHVVEVHTRKERRSQCRDRVKSGDILAAGSPRRSAGLHRVRSYPGGKRLVELDVDGESQSICAQRSLLQLQDPSLQPTSVEVMACSRCCLDAH